MRLPNPPNKPYNMKLYQSLNHIFRYTKTVFVARWLECPMPTLSRREQNGEEVSRLPHTQPIIPYSSYFIPKTKGFILPLLAIFMLISCSDDYSLNQGFIQDNEDSLTIDFLIPEAAHILSRADNDEERKINNLTILIFDSDEKLIQKEEINNNSPYFPKYGVNEFTIKFNKNNATKKEGDNINIYAVANTLVKVSASENRNLLKDYESGRLLLDFQTIKNNLNYDSQNGLLMSGKMKTTGGQNEIVLVRSAAKVSVKDETTAGNFRLLHTENGGFGERAFDIYDSDPECFLMASTLNHSNFFCNPSKFNSDLTNHQLTDVKEVISDTDLNGNTTYRYDAYVNPTQMHDGDKILNYIVLYGEYTDKSNKTKCYYAIPLYSQTLQKHYDIEPNHWYDIRLIEVNHAGASSIEEALKNPCDYVIYQIHDHTPEVLSMVSDGVHELGVERSVTLSPTQKSVTFRVKWYSARENEEFDPEELIAEVINGDWLTVDKSEIKIENEESKTDSDNFGLQFNFTVQVKEGTRFYTDQEATIRVKWRTLYRDVAVHYDAGFDIAEVCDVTLTIKDVDHNQTSTIWGYWSFISGQGRTQGQESSGSVSDDKLNQSSIPILFGMQPDDLADNKVRNEGLHFPMPYGLNAPENPWTYEYDIDFIKLENILKKTYYNNYINSISVSTTGGSFFSPENIIWEYKLDSQSHPVVNLKLKENIVSSYSYATGRITFRVAYGETNNLEYRNVTLDLYHTGFFHYENKTNYLSSENIGYYYYEVIELEGEGSSKYWLDRNIGAKSNMMFVDDGSESGIGNEEAAGLYFNIADPRDYDDPTIIETMCPPGYHIPVSSEWNPIRLSSSFITEDVTDPNSLQTYISSYYQSKVIDNKQPIKVYFPKTRYYNIAEDNNPPIESQKYVSFSNMGDASSGYYWTATTAPGMEKENMGNWLRSLYINGSSTTYNNADIVNHRLPVRCVAGGSAPSQDNNYISFNVHNVTHVYLFNYETGVPLYAFPGKAVSSTASSSKWQYFYSTTTADINKLAVIFTKIESNGSVTIYSRDTKDGNSFVTNRTLKQAVGDWANGVDGYYWSIQDSKDYDLFYYDFCDSAKVREGDNVSHDKPGSDDCNADSENSGSQGGDNGELKGKVTKYDPTRPNDPQTVWEGEVIFSESWDDNCQDLLNVNFNWDEVPAGTLLKVYTTSTGSKYNVQLKSILSDGSTWSKLDGNPENYTNPEDNPISIKLTETILNALRSPNKGLVIYGLYYKLTKVEISPDDGSGGSSQGGESIITPLDPDTHEEQTIWEGYVDLTQWANSFQELQNFDWSTITINSIIKFYIERTGEVQIKVTSNDGWKDLYMLKESEGNINNGIGELPVDEFFIQHYVESQKYLILQGQNYYLKSISVTLK